MEKSLIERIRTGLATVADLAAEKPEDVLAVKRDNSVPQSRFFAEKSYGVQSDKRQVLGVPHSTEGVDRMGDIIRVKGWQLDAYKNNPVLLFGHDSSSLPIGKATKIRKGRSVTGMKSLLIDEVYHEADINPESELVWRMVENGALPGRSVGFLPIDVHEPETEEEREKLGLGKYGLEFREQELLESSIVPVPANAEALQGKCYIIAQATAKKAIEEGVATWSDVQRLAGVLPITEADQTRIEREARRSKVSLEGIDLSGLTTGTLNDVELTSNETEEVQWTLSLDNGQQEEYLALERHHQIIEEMEDDAETEYQQLQAENEQLREQVADLTRAIGALAKTTEDRSECVDTEEVVEHRSNDETEESLYDTLTRKVEERRQAKRFGDELADRLRTHLGTGDCPKD